jgi:hypothetical protein
MRGKKSIWAVTKTEFLQLALISGVQEFSGPQDGMLGFATLTANLPCDLLPNFRVHMPTQICIQTFAIRFLCSLTRNF